MEKKKVNSKLKLWSLTLIVMILFITGCGGAKQETTTSQSEKQGTDTATEAETIKIGLILSTTGTFAPLSEGIKNGFELYLEQHDGMLGGKKVELKLEDDEANPQVALRKYRQLVHSEKVNFLVGPISSAVVYALRDEVEKDKIVLIDANAAGDDLAWAKKSDYVYRTSFSNWQNGHSTGAYLANNVGKTAIAIAPDYPAGKEVVRAFKAAFEEAGGKVVKESYPKLGTNDFATYITDAANTKPDLVYAFFAGSDGIRFVQQYKDFGLQGKIPLGGSLEFGDELIIQPTGDATEGIISGVVYSPYLDNEQNNQFVEAYQKKYNKLPNMFSVEGYDSAQILDKAITEAGSIKSEDVIKVLKGISFDSPRGPITIDPKTNNPIQNFYVSKNTKKDNVIVPEVLETFEKLTMPETSPFPQ
ncbi:amino acid/amide ABC transporter substrate-binding protein, HAAT family [Schinkia azotoformans MEV2011]|uniref:Amino acid/amide ABC transporter substrate-binding protein, HAAT family n=1 Tax=Schinkia azotoformans MEV2011 TaxID=1348973 RepID=A0A072NTS7_SCHAZ|nr:ABC transporter substrate-binding protein [Schinkia azotoformans]KEF36610.1 amino acid/amide ABC transporter substrate-binding protein, HAAT family [Schinkia azotoformans MEV2011]MEC1695575.1 ABC transporter substrate-binding protein [Schinkia azotoformans]MEC1723970.1 ABC transporter substrate-binding protein [Schinkia azotoformans]MEC1740778.1 ABC transporter substrate-binding protein [Schinkia azotoformans]MEC1743898.1 ABC transporter substrate-binding protein [Schinkia azotoformans]